ncbi:DnaJ domain-containing protein [Sphingosinicella sp.]|uniref:DnaJ domain-containing protein n=1 Tax=Sphingosinicella sp. TaxID=1917971 RepID=UPI00403803D0
MIAKLAILLGLVAILYLWWRRRAVAASAMRPAEARAILQISARASVEEVREAHRRLIAKVHPDAGGSADLARRVNAARDTLLNELKRR